MFDFETNIRSIFASYFDVEFNTEFYVEINTDEILSAIFSGSVNKTIILCSINHLIRELAERTPSFLVS